MPETQDRSSIWLQITVKDGRYTMLSYKRDEEYRWKYWLTNYFATADELMAYLIPFMVCRPLGQVDISFGAIEE